MIIILDCGSQLTLNIARRIRENSVFCEIYPYNYSIEKIKEKKPEGIIISGGSLSVNMKDPLLCDKGIFDMNIPVLGICYGMQSMAKLLDGKVDSGSTREYGKAEIDISNLKNPLFFGINKKTTVWMSHGDSVVKLPKGFLNAAKTTNTNGIDGIENASIWNKEKKLFAVQFHPEVDHTIEGRKILSNFIDICNCKRDWKMENFIESAVADIKKKAGKGIVIGGVSGGVDSTVAAALMYKAIGKNFKAIFVNNGLIRQNEAEEVTSMFEKQFSQKLIYKDATKLFLKELSGIVEPEKKRKIIGKLFIDVFAKEAKKQKDAKFLMQGTLYPDIIESQSVFGGPTSMIKSHHNVGGLPEKMNLQLIEPFRFLFKDEVRKIGEILNLPKEAVWRHPFPGPGLGVRVIGKITEEKLAILRKADKIYIDELKKTGEYYNIWQAFAVLLPVKSVGVMGDKRSYDNVIALRAVTSNDGMTADWAKVPYHVLEKVSSRIINKVKGVNRVVYDISQKPPATIEWE
jgi:GMP synthase (glutamine-hydrolysing)